MALNGRLLVKFSILSSIFIPGHMLEWAIEWTWLGLQLLGSFIFLTIFLRKLKSPAGLNPIFWVFFFLSITLIGMIASLYSHIFLGMQIDPKDFSDHLRLIIFIVFGLFIGSAVDQSYIDFFTLTLKSVVLYNLLTSAILILGVPLLFDAVLFLYSDAKIQFELSHIRIGIPFANPNFAAFFFIFALSYFIFFFTSPVYAILCIFCIFLTGSRSGLISITPIFFLGYFYVFNNAIRNFKSLTFFVSYHFLFFSLYFFLFDEWIEESQRFLELAEALSSGGIAQVNTANIRIEVIRDAIKVIESSPYLGVGPGRYYGLDVTDSQLIAWPLMYGIPASALIILFFIRIFYMIICRAKLRIHVMGSIGICLAFFLMLSFGDFMKNYRLFFISILFIHFMQLIAVKKNSGAITLLRK